jgi:hypothetical protein
MVDAQELRKRSGMAVVLSQWVLELALFAKQNLRPLGLSFAAEDPPTSVLRLYDEDAEARDNDMINLCRSIRGRDDDVVKSRVKISVQRTRK